MAVLAPIPSANVNTATEVKSGALSSRRIVRRILAGRSGMVGFYGFWGSPVPLLRGRRERRPRRSTRRRGAIFSKPKDTPCLRVEDLRLLRLLRLLIPLERAPCFRE